MNRLKEMLSQYNIFNCSTIPIRVFIVISTTVLRVIFTYSRQHCFSHVVICSSNQLISD